MPGVVNNITPAPAAQKVDIRQRVMDALKRHAEVQADHIDVDVDSSGSIRLSGLIDDWEERRTTCASGKSCPPATGTAMDPGVHARPGRGCRAPAQDAGQQAAVDGVAPAGGGRAFDEQDQPAPRPEPVGVIATLAVLREHELVATRREARTIHCSLAEDPAQCIIDTLHSIYCAADRPLRGAD